MDVRDHTYISGRESGNDMVIVMIWAKFPPRTRFKYNTVAFVDNMLILARRQTQCESKNKVKNMMEREGGSLDWSCAYQCRFVLDKFGVMGMMMRRETSKSRHDPHTPV